VLPDALVGNREVRVEFLFCHLGFSGVDFWEKDFCVFFERSKILSFPTSSEGERWWFSISSPCGLQWSEGVVFALGGFVLCSFSSVLKISKLVGFRPFPLVVGSEELGVRGCGFGPFFPYGLRFEFWKKHRNSAPK